MIYRYDRYTGWPVGIVPILLSAALFVPGCRSGCRGSATTSDAAVIAVSPLANPEPATPGRRARVVAPVPQQRVGRPFEVTPRASMDASQPRDARPRLPPELANDGGEADDRREQSATEARVRTEGAVDMALRSAFNAFQRCYQEHQGGTARAVLKFRLHRSGYVVEPEAATGNDRLDACMRGVLSNLRVAGVETDSLTIERTIQGIVK